MYEAPIEIIYGKIEHQIEDGYYSSPCVCSYCGMDGNHYYSYCPYCGADMREEESQ